MAHKVHPKLFRIKETQDWSSQWFATKSFKNYLEEDFRIREFLRKKLREAGLGDIKIKRSPGNIDVIISTSRPGLVIGRGGQGIEELKKALESKVLREKRQLKLQVEQIRDVWGSANLVAQWVAQQIEKRVPYRRCLKHALDRMMSSKSVKGARVEVSGRLNGVEIARKEFLQSGQLPRQTLRANIDYAYTQAHCTYGVIGVKVWIYKEKEEEKNN